MHVVLCQSNRTYKHCPSIVLCPQQTNSTTVRWWLLSREIGWFKQRRGNVVDKRMRRKRRAVELQKLTRLITLIWWRPVQLPQLRRFTICHDSRCAAVEEVEAAAAPAASMWLVIGWLYYVLVEWIKTTSWWGCWNWWRWRWWWGALHLCVSTWMTGWRWNGHTKRVCGSSCNSTQLGEDYCTCRNILICMVMAKTIQWQQHPWLAVLLRNGRCSVIGRIFWYRHRAFRYLVDGG